MRVRIGLRGQFGSGRLLVGFEDIYGSIEKCVTLACYAIIHRENLARQKNNSDLLDILVPL